jgi:serine protease Do
VVTQVEDGSPAAEYGFQPGQVISRVNRTPVRSVEEFHAALAEAGDSELILFLVSDGRVTRFVPLRLSE